MGIRRITLGIYNTYDPLKMREPHRRAIARAGALCAAYEINLALFGFPLAAEQSTPLEMADFVAKSTTIGQEGKYLLEIAGEGKVQIFDYVSKGFPPQLGIPIATTCKPKLQKKISPGEIIDIIRYKKGVLLILGLGPKGLSDELKKICTYHLDITGRGYSLETCTAMGAIAGYLQALRDES